MFLFFIDFYMFKPYKICWFTAFLC